MRQYVCLSSRAAIMEYHLRMANSQLAFADSSTNIRLELFGQIAMLKPQRAVFNRRNFRSRGSGETMRAKACPTRARGEEKAFQCGRGSHRPSGRTLALPYYQRFHLQTTIPSLP